MSQELINALKQMAEFEYYLPPKVKAASEAPADSFWQDRAESQDTFIAACKQGHTLIANQIIDGVAKGQPPTVKELYQTAARVRRAIAITNQSQTLECMLFGQPLAVSANNQLHDIVLAEGQNRFKAHFPVAHTRFKEILAHAESGHFRAAFGNDYFQKVSRNAHETRIDIFRTGVQTEVASLVMGADERQLRLYHARAKDRDALFAMADTHLQKILSTPDMDNKTLMRELGAISLDLFHATPLKRGSQTATLMVMAGITKAIGMDVVPRELETDHFLEAELTPYKSYIKNYGSKFITPPERGERPQEPFPVDDRFIADANSRLRGLYSHIPDPLARLTRYIRDCEDPFIPSPPTVTAMEVKDGVISGLKVYPRSQQEMLEKALEFIGYGDVIDMLALEPGKYAPAPGRGGRSGTGRQR